MTSRKPPAKSRPAPPTEGERRLQRFIDAVEKGQPLDQELLKQLATDFTAVLSGQEPKHALHLAKRRGRREASLQIQLWHVMLAAMVVREMAGGRTKLKALEIVSAEQQVPYGTLERYYNNHKRKARRLLRAVDRATAAWQQAEKAMGDLLLGLLRHFDGQK
ncbi:MAG: hypothetical protein ACREVE_05910 [Gammaproteobacteria bacterium]